MVDQVRVFQYYDYDKGFNETNRGWHEIHLYNIDQEKHISIVLWLYEHIDNPERHARWMYDMDRSGFKFRYERDYIYFTLRWS